MTLTTAATELTWPLPAPCVAQGCICGGQLTQQDCDVRSDVLWAAILAEPGTSQPTV